MDIFTIQGEGGCLKSKYKKFHAENAENRKVRKGLIIRHIIFAISANYFANFA